MNIYDIKEIYGEEVFDSISENKENFKNNVLYLKEKDITIIDDVVNRYGIVLLYEPTEFKKKIDKLINNLGEDYINLLENDVTLMEEIL